MLFVVTIKTARVRPRPTPEDFLRATGYAVLTLWAIVYFVFPPISSLVALDLVLRTIWMAVTAIGGLAAMVGSLLRIDIKLELPGIGFGILGPLFYAVTQALFILSPTEDTGPPETRFALLVFALLPVFIVLPRAYGLIEEARRLKKINTESVETAQSILQTLSTGSTPTGGKK